MSDCGSDDWPVFIFTWKHARQLFVIGLGGVGFGVSWRPFAAFLGHVSEYLSLQVSSTQDGCHTG
jgi:hypothetical protein